MRRAQNTPAISPQQLKHFAAVAVVLTFLLAIFATNSDFGAKAQLDEVQKRNQLAKAEKAKGASSNKITLNNVAAYQPDSGSFGDSAGISPGSGSDGGGGGVSMADTRGPIGGFKVTPRNGTERVEVGGPKEVTDYKAKGYMQRGALSPEMMRRAKENARAMSGSSEGND